MNDNLNKTIFQNALIHVTCCRLTSDLEIKHLHLGQGKGNEFCQIIWTKIKVRVITMHLSLHFVVTLWQYFTFFDVEIHIQAATKIAIVNLSAVKKWPYH